MVVKPFWAKSSYDIFPQKLKSTQELNLEYLSMPILFE